MNENVDSLMIRLVGLALAVLMMAGMTIYTGLFPKASAKAADTHAAVISVQEGYVAAEDVQQNVCVVNSTKIRAAHPGAVRFGVRLFCGEEGGGIVL